MSEDRPHVSVLNDANAGERPVSMPIRFHPAAVAWRKLSYFWSTAILTFSLFVILWGIGNRWNNSPWNVQDSHPALEIIVFLILLLWIALLEGCQISIVGLQAVDREMYKATHPHAYKCCGLVHKGANVERFLNGRQFLILFLVFLLNRVGGSGRQDDFHIGDWHWSSEATDFFWNNSVLLMLVIVTLGQLPTQLVAADKMLGFMELPFLAYYTVVIPCLFVESLGLTHFSYLLKDLLVKIAGIETSDGDTSKKLPKNTLYYARGIFSVCTMLFSGVFIFKGLYLHQTLAAEGVGWKDVPGWGAIIIAIVLLLTMGIAEGTQVSCIALAKTRTNVFKKQAPVAYRVTELVYSGYNMQAFLVGRQVLVAIMMVLLARVTIYAGSGGQLSTETDWGMGNEFNEGLLQTGFLGAIFVVNIAQLIPQVTASIFPISFLNNYITYGLIRLMLLIELLGFVNACWPIASAIDSKANLNSDAEALDRRISRTLSGNGPSIKEIEQAQSLGDQVYIENQTQGIKIEHETRETVI